jgi:hypothetical protein
MNSAHFCLKFDARSTLRQLGKQVWERGRKIVLETHSLALTYVFPSHIPSRTSTIEGGLAFVMFLCRMAHPHTCKGTMEHIWGWTRGYITDWTNYIRGWFIHEWRHLLSLNVEYASQHCHTWAERIGRKIGLNNPLSNHCIGFIDGVFRSVLPPSLPPSLFPSTPPLLPSFSHTLTNAHPPPSFLSSFPSQVLLQTPRVSRSSLQRLLQRPWVQISVNRCSKWPHD